MLKRVLLVAGLYLISMTMLAAAKDMSWDGWISDSQCGAKGANAAHAACAKKCIDGGAKPVLVTDKDQKVVAIRQSRRSRGPFRPSREADRHVGEGFDHGDQREHAQGPGRQGRRHERDALSYAMLQI